MFLQRKYQKQVLPEKLNKNQTIISNKVVPNKTSIAVKTKLAMTIATCLSVFHMQAASAACSISPNNSEEYIQSIRLNGGSYLSNGDTLQDGDVLELRPGYYGSAYKDDWSIWIDLNGDGDFSDSGEQVFTSSSNSNSMVSATLTIPSTTSASNTELRVLLHAYDVDDDSCGYSSYGDSQDFSINLGDNDNGGGTDNGGSSDDYALSKQPRGGSDEHILMVEIGNDEHTSGNDDGYGDFTNNKTFTISDGDSITLIPITSWDTDWAIWIDSDNNRSFDSDEKVFSGSGNRDDEVRGNLDLSNISSGTARMRIAMNGDGIADATGFTYGEIEDYTVNVQSDGGTDTGGSTDTGDKEYGSHIKWGHNSVHVKVFRFEFEDADLNYSMTRIDNEMNEIIAFYHKDSFGRFDVTYEVHDEIIHISESKSTYDNASSWDWVYKTQDALEDLGEDIFNLDDNTIYLTIAPQIAEFGPKASVAPTGIIKMYDSIDRTQAGAIAHEMAHAMGLHHAQGLDGGDSIIGVNDPDSESINYGNIQSMMGFNHWSMSGFNLYYKNFFESWDIEKSVPVINESGTYKIYALDQGSIGNDGNGNIGIKLKAGDGDVTYWVEYRTISEANEDYGPAIVDTNGVYINLEGYFPDDDTREGYYGVSYLLDMLPNSFEVDPDDSNTLKYDFYDAALTIGNSYTDELGGGFTIKPVAKGGTLGTADAWIEVEVVIH
ncbi:MAG: GEVED domain-containing protein [Colwellia sp.]|nr:GEVED domain-containing protein [Colwellia sp.]